MINAALLSALAALVLRAFVIRLHKDYYYHGFFGDSAVHYSILRQLKLEWNPSHIPQFLAGELPMSYPRGFHRYASLFPMRWIRKHPPLPNLVLFVVSSGLFGAYAKYAETHLLHASSSFTPLVMAFFLVSVSSLVFYFETYHYLGFSERFTGRMCTGAFMLLTHFGAQYGDHLSLALALPFAAFGLLASKFSRQSLILTTPLVCLLTLSPWPLAALAAGFAGAFAFSPRYFWWSLRIQYRHLENYAHMARQDDEVRKLLASRSMADFGKFAAAIKKLRTDPAAWREVIPYLFLEPFRAALFYPEFWGIALLAPGLLLAPPLAVTLIIYLLVSSRFRFIGEAFRYIDFNLYYLLPIFLAQAALNSPVGVIATAVPLYSVFFALVVYAKVSQSSMRDLRASNEALNEAAERSGITEDSVVYPITLRAGADLFCRIPCRTFWWQPGTITKDIFARFCEASFFPKREWDDIFEEFEVTHVLCEKHQVRGLSWAYDFSKLTPVFENERYSVYKAGDTQ